MLSATALLHRFSWFCFLAVGILVFFYVPWINLSNLNLGVLVCIGLASCAAVLAVAARLSKHLPSPAVEIRARQTALLLVTALAIGTVLRVGCLLLFPPFFVSDMKDYWETALRLHETGTYANMHEAFIFRAWRPPGYPAFLAACVSLIGHKSWVPAVGNLLFYLLTSLSVFTISKDIAGPRAGLFAAFLLALWPSYIAINGLALAEPMATALLMVALWALFHSKRHRMKYIAIAGALFGLGALVRPALLLLPVFGVLFLVSSNSRCRFRSIIVLLAATVLTMAPWTIRNYFVLNAVVPVSTNGGDVFYRANNPLATGSWTPRGERDLDSYKADEILWNQLGYRWGVEWIKENPFAFVKLALKKQGNLLGGDPVWIYVVPTGGRGDQYMDLASRVFRVLTNLWWIATWSLAVIAVFRARAFFLNDPRGMLLLLLVVFVVVTHSVYESQPRHHILFIGILSIVSALAVWRPSVPKIEDRR